MMHETEIEQTLWGVTRLLGNILHWMEFMAWRGEPLDGL
jgi:hypothetical protein